MAAEHAVKCGDKGFLTATGQPCGQTIGRSASACLWHSRNAQERRALALKGGIASRMRTIVCLPGDTPSPVLDSPEGVRTLIADTINDTRTGRLDHRIAMVVIAGATAALRMAELQLAAKIAEHERRLELRA
jgi:hypothetical protein